MQRATAWQRRWPQIGAIHGLGAIRSLEFVRDPMTREPAPEATKNIVKICHERGVLILSAGTYGNVIRLLMPLVISDEQFTEALQVLQAAIASVFESSTAA